MAELPIEQVTQRHPRGIVAAPGVVLWATETTYAFPRGYVENVDEVEPGEVVLAQMASPEFFWTVVSGAKQTGLEYGEGLYDHGEYGEDGAYDPELIPGIFQSFTFGDFDFGDGEFGGVETVWNVERPRYSYNVNGDGL